MTGRTIINRLVRYNDGVGDIIQRDADVDHLAWHQDAVLVVKRYPQLDGAGLIVDDIAGEIDRCGEPLAAAVAHVYDCRQSVTALAGLNEWTGDLQFLRGDIPRRWNPPLYRLDTELPAGARPLLVGQAAVFHLRHTVVYNTVFNPETIELLARERSPDELRRLLHERKITHVYVDWKEIERHRQPGGYGFTAYVTPARFAGWVAAGVLDRPLLLGEEQELYEVR